MAPTVLRLPIRPCSTVSRATVRRAKKSKSKEPGIARLFAIQAFQAQSLRRGDVLPPARETVWRRWRTLARTVRRMDAPIEPPWMGSRRVLARV
ncbi:hypothetical protein, partial [Stenotrophomonas geniculata]|uniref:hypothetical protein n=1 Tax=Stenotrophomonas geniculata TaxID=86188 RepID=UPI002E78DAE7